MCRFICQPLFLQLLLYFFVGFSLRFLIDTLILRFAVAQTPHSRCLGWMSKRCLYRFSIYKGEEEEEEGGRGRGGKAEDKSLYRCVPATASLLFFPPGLLTENGL